MNDTHVEGPAARERQDKVIASLIPLERENATHDGLCVLLTVWCSGRTNETFTRSQMWKPVR